VIKKERDGVRRYEGRAKEALEKHRDALTEYENLADELGVEPGDLGLAWTLHRPGITAPIIGPRIQDQLDSAIRAVELKLEQASLDRLDQIFPGYKTAPEDYAW
jgi:aryl-alcohol dehydrogenase-like predicted oxidoreductase